MNPNESDKPSKEDEMILLLCPFCSGGFVSETDHHGEWIEHHASDRLCPLDLFQFHTKDDIKRWNTRSESKLIATQKALEETEKIALEYQRYLSNSLYELKVSRILSPETRTERMYKVDALNIIYQSVCERLYTIAKLRDEEK